MIDTLEQIAKCMNCTLPDCRPWLCGKERRRDRRAYHARKRDERNERARALAKLAYNGATPGFAAKQLGITREECETLTRSKEYAAEQDRQCRDCKAKSGAAQGDMKTPYSELLVAAARKWNRRMPREVRCGD